ncbi:MAG: hypothetical protein ACJA08_002144 [Cyclobacteriaceae bacterium]|jgi:hypothetical protein
MGTLSKKQIDLIAEDLRIQGITFEPLHEELMDHMISDIETQMEKGNDFPTAWDLVKTEIPNNHFKNIQKETMEILSKKINPLKVFGKISFGLLTLATTFKMLHWPGAAVLLISFLVVSCVTLLIGSSRSVYVYRESKGRGVIMLATFLIISFIAGLCFKVMHFPGATVLLLFSVVALSILIPALSFYFLLSKKKLKDHLLIRLIEDNQNTLENTALILIGFGLLFNYSSILFGNENFGGVIFFIFSIIITGIYIYTFTWGHYVNDQESNKSVNWALLIVSSLAFIMFMLPAIGNILNFTFRQFSVFGAIAFFIMIVIVHYAKFSESANRKILAPLSSVLLFYPFIRLGIKLEWFEGALGGITTNNNFILGFLAFLLVLLVVFRKERLFKALVLLTIASHMIPTI